MSHCPSLNPLFKQELLSATMVGNPFRILYFTKTSFFSRALYFRMHCLGLDLWNFIAGILRSTRFPRWFEQQLISRILCFTMSANFTMNLDPSGFPSGYCKRDTKSSHPLALDQVQIQLRKGFYAIVKEHTLRPRLIPECFSPTGESVGRAYEIFWGSFCVVPKFCSTCRLLV